MTPLSVTKLFPRSWSHMWVLGIVQLHPSYYSCSLLGIFLSCICEGSDPRGLSIQVRSCLCQLPTRFGLEMIAILPFQMLAYIFQTPGDYVTLLPSALKPENASQMHNGVNEGQSWFVFLPCRPLSFSNSVFVFVYFLSVLWKTNAYSKTLSIWFGSVLKSQTDLLNKIYLFIIYLCECFAHMFVGAPSVCLVPTKVRRGRQFP